MKALILVGGFGTRLRPLTFSKPKPLVDFANRPMIMHQIEALAKVGVKEIVLAVNYQPKTMVDAMHEVEELYKVKIHFSIESEPLGTAGPLALARDILAKDDSPFFVLNSDVICEFPFEELLNFHKEHGCEGTLMTTPVEDPTKYGVIVQKEGSCAIDRFVEKPKEFVGNQINAGIYIFNPKMLDRIEPKPTSIEKDVFPFMAKAGQLHAMPLAGFWADVGQPKDFLSGTALYLESLHHHQPDALKKAEDIVGHVMAHPSAKIGKNCKIGPNVVLGPNTVIGDGVRISNAVIMDGSSVRDNACVHDSIIGWASSVGRWGRLENITVLGEDVHVADEVFVNGGCVLPHKSVGANILEPRIVM
ncbi:nucleotide-diphospho-sugar transferase [Fimicolochytrium jonesii]|uniref:nucleotide-diphospho-sugar transferase n=1 Tax=Fimicolochytrium jonesii TaxID=1396493 RepID=UPI0022FEB5E8|nr:nucleotide-diphospho-sugar transferase [Fimicolochytrium jonesii]KAI8815910.1 nucleotide-diphospho-sugar transferase [Fimicolochytrium jonesii]